MQDIEAQPSSIVEDIHTAADLNDDSTLHNQSYNASKSSADLF